MEGHDNDIHTLLSSCGIGRKTHMNKKSQSNILEMMKIVILTICGEITYLP